MTIDPRPRRTPFDFVAAVTAMFQTSDGNAFAWRLLFWTTAFMSIALLVILPFIAPHFGVLFDLNQQNMQALLEGRTPTPVDSAAVSASLKKMILPAIVMTLAWWAAYAAGEAALHRKILRGEEYPKRPLRFGADELRVMLAQIGVWMLFFLVYIGGIVLMVAGTEIPVLGVVIAIVAVLAMIFLLINIPVRFAPAAALSVMNKKAHLMAARKITKGRFWPLFGAYIVVYLGGYILNYAVLLTAMILVSGDSNFLLNIYGMGDTPPSEMMVEVGQRLKNPIFMFFGVLGVIGYAASYSIWMLSMAGIGAYAVKWWEQDDPIAPFD